jgi:hypothetical protein
VVIAGAKSTQVLAPRSLCNITASLYQGSRDSKYTLSNLYCLSERLGRQCQ